jgi:uncharacterized membrane protein
LLDLDTRHLAVGMIGTWLVGIGRYWDDPKADLFRSMGLGSVVYVFVLAFILWLLVKPFFVKEWSYQGVLTFVTLTSFPGLLYAIPVERWTDIDTAALINVWFLAVVAFWRLALLFFYFRRITGLNYLYISIVALLPVCLIIVTLTIFNIEKGMFQVMGGIREKTSDDLVNQILFLLSLVSTMLAGPLVIGYPAAILRRWKLVKAGNPKSQI